MGIFTIERRNGTDPAEMSPLIKHAVTKFNEIGISKSKIYEHFTPSTTGRPISPVVDDIDSVSAVFKYSELGNTALLNFASFVEPGGGCLRGATAQEEMICYESNLYYILSAFSEFYKENRRDTNNNLYYNRAIYSPIVRFARGADFGREVVTDNDPLTKEAECAVITCAAPFANGAIGVSYDRYLKTLASRIKFVLDIAEDNGIETLILGAFGCGVFGNNPYDVARIFKHYLESGKYNFKNVVFAIPTKSEKSLRNYEVFSEIFK